MPVMSGKRAFLDLLKQEGVDIIFGNPGTTELPLMDAFATETDIRYILGLQEARQGHAPESQSSGLHESPPRDTLRSLAASSL